MRHSHGARRGRGSDGADHSALAAAEWRGLPVDVDKPRGGAPRRKLGETRRAEKALLAEWERTPLKRRPRHIGLDEIQRGKGQRFWTVLSHVVHGEVMGLRQDRSETTMTALLTEDLTARQPLYFVASRLVPWGVCSQGDQEFREKMHLPDLPDLHVVRRPRLDPWGDLHKRSKSSGKNASP